jgi:transglutaminase-like putative cysteine protease
VATAAVTRDAQGAVERYFEISLYLLVLTGFLTLAITGKLDLLSLLFVGAALAFRGYLLLRRQVVQLSEQWTTYLTLAYIVFYLADFFLISQSFVGASVHLVLFSMVVKIFSVQRDRDLMYLAVLSFLEVLAAAVLTVDSIFLLAFAVFLLLAVTTFISLEMRRTARRTGRFAREHSGVRRLGRSLSATALLLVLAILVAALVIFFVLPRVSANYLASLAPRSVITSGFSNEVDLGAIGQIQQSNEVVMHVRIEGDTTGAHQDLHWRGLALANFDGHKWTNPPDTLEMVPARQSTFALSRISGADTPIARDWRPLNYRVMMEPIGTNLFFFPGQAMALYGNYRAIGYDRGLAFYSLDNDHIVSIYRAVVNTKPPEPSAAGGELPPNVSLYYLQLPGRVDPRVRDLAEKVTAGAPDNVEKARLLEDHLRSRYGYTLELPASTPTDPIADFLFRRKRGHCEYFASSMAVMLRTLGIPSRVVNGFRGGEFNSVTGSYIVRARDAHSWVEAYFPGTGWMTFDPTPASPQPANVSGLQRLLYYLDAMREFWREWVINYDFGHQTQVSNTVVVQSRRFFYRWRYELQRRYEQLLARARKLQAQASETPQKYGATGVIAVLGLILLLNLRRIVGALRARRLANAPGRAPQLAASIWYERMTRSVGKRGYQKVLSQTPNEFVITIDDPYLRARVEAFTRAYERARFADSPDDAQQLPRLYEEILTRP